LSAVNSASGDKPDYFVHESAYVDLPCQIGKGSQIWHFSHVMRDAEIGENCKIGQNVFVASGVKIGRNVKIQNNVSVYAGVTLEDDVFCGPSCVFTNIKTPRSAVPRNTADDYLSTYVKQGASIGANSTIVCGSNIGRCAFIGAGSTVTKDVPDYALVYGNPAKQHGWMCECGLRLEPFTDKTVCQECHREYQYDGDRQIQRIE
jgi:UDP-2-acetamido-3-amino-2,3-dideoxy-glucuronate N-acetyltransferase